jgi:F-type H+-transporting ATPase subunit delta
MTLRGLARRYANALYDVLHKAGGDLDRARRDLAAFVEVVQGHEELSSLVEHPTISPQKKKDLIAALLDRGGDTMAEVRRLLLMLAEQDRLGIAADVSSLFADRVMEQGRVKPAEVVTAAPLTDANRVAIAAALGRATGAEVTITERVDPAIVGGVVARVGSLVFDGSVSRQLEKMRRRLMAEA